MQTTNLSNWKAILGRKKSKRKGWVIDFFLCVFYVLWSSLVTLCCLWCIFVLFFFFRSSIFGFSVVSMVYVPSFVFCVVYALLTLILACFWALISLLFCVIILFILCFSSDSIILYSLTWIRHFWQNMKFNKH